MTSPIILSRLNHPSNGQSNENVIQCFKFNAIASDLDDEASRSRNPKRTKEQMGETSAVGAGCCQKVDSRRDNRVGRAES
jgi:hypothetical protein